MLRRLVRLPRARLHMSSRSQLSTATAAARLAQTAGHLTTSSSVGTLSENRVRMASTTAGSSSSATANIEFKEIKNLTCFGAGLMGS